MVVEVQNKERVLVIQLLAVMLENAEFVDTVADSKNTPGIENVSYFSSFCKINGRLFKINVTVKKMLDIDRRFAYYYAATHHEA